MGYPSGAMTVSGLRIAVATARYPPYTGGIELHTEEVARRHAAAGAEVTILTTDLSGRLPKRERRDGVEIRRLSAWPRRRDYYFSPALYWEIVRGEWDLVHVQGFQTFVAPTAMLAALRARLPYLVTFHAGGHSSRPRKVLGSVQQDVLRPLLARAERLVALTDVEAEDRMGRLRLPRERFIVIPNGSDLPAPSATVERDSALIASIGRLERYKGHHRVIEALPHILQRRPDVRLWIAGSGRYEPSLRQLVDQLRVRDHVEIRSIPVRERTQMADELARVGVVVCLSEFESHGIAVLEALSLGCRAVVARTPGLIALVDAGLARGVALDSPPADIAQAVLEELDRPPIARPPRLPTWDECAEKLRQLYEDVVAARRVAEGRAGHD
jgi:glycogen synthase